MAVSYQCCFCGQPVEAVDAHTVRIALTNLWQGTPPRDLRLKLCALLRPFLTGRYSTRGT